MLSQLGSLMSTPPPAESFMVSLFSIYERRQVLCLAVMSLAVVSLSSYFRSLATCYYCCLSLICNSNVACLILSASYLFSTSYSLI